MTTDITELAPAMKAAAEKLGGAQWQTRKGFSGIEVIVKGSLERLHGFTSFQPVAADLADTKTARAIALFSPANVLALVEALEKAQQRIDELENDEVRQRLANAEHQLYLAELAKHNLKASRKAQFRKRRAAEKRIAELESRAVKLPKPYAYLRENDGQIQISIGAERPSDRSGGYATPWFAIYTDAGIKVEAE